MMATTSSSFVAAPESESEARPRKPLLDRGFSHNELDPTAAYTGKFERRAYRGVRIGNPAADLMRLLSVYCSMKSPSSSTTMKMNLATLTHPSLAVAGQAITRSRRIFSPQIRRPRYASTCYQRT